MPEATEQDKERLRAQLSLIVDTSSLRWQILPIISTLLAGLVTILPEDAIQPSWLAKAILLASLLLIPVTLVIYEQKIREKELNALQILKSILAKYDPSAVNDLDKFRGGWEAYFPQVCVYTVSVLVILILIGMIIGWSCYGGDSSIHELFYVAPRIR